MFLIVLLAMMTLLAKFYRQDRKRTQYNNCQRRCTSQEDSSFADDETKSKFINGMLGFREAITLDYDHIFLSSEKETKSDV